MIKKFKDFLLESSINKNIIIENNLQGKTIINVDIQPEYEKFIKKRFDLEEWAEFINENADSNIIVFLYNGEDTLGMIEENDYKMWLIDLGIEEEIIESATFYDKGYGFFRYCMDNSIDEDNIADLVKFMIRHDITDSREITKEMWDIFIEENKQTGQDIRELLELSDDTLYIPDLIDFIKNYQNIVLTGGDKNECLKEVEIALLSLDKDYDTQKNFIY